MSTLGVKSKNFDASVWINKKDLRRMDRFIQLGLAASLQAIEESKLDSLPDKRRIGVLLSSGIGGLSAIEESSVSLSQGAFSFFYSFYYF
jgi:3-oxoacyl-[acyl-carrier-protein] synthase II